MTNEEIYNAGKIAVSYDRQLEIVICTKVRGRPPLAGNVKRLGVCASSN